MKYLATLIATLAGLRPFMMLYFIYTLGSTTQVGALLFGLVGVTYMVAAVASGYLADKYGRFRLMRVGLLIFLGGFYKMSLFFNGVTLIIATVFKVKNHKKLLPAVCIFLLVVAVIFEPSYTYHKWMNPFDTNAFYITFLHIIPLLLLLIQKLKSRSAN
jgi:MFS family permease